MEKQTGQAEKRRELAAFLALAVLLAPATAALIVGGIGLVIWLSELAG